MHSWVQTDSAKIPTHLGESQVLVQGNKDDPLDPSHDHLDHLDQQLQPLVEDNHESLHGEAQHNAVHSGPRLHRLVRTQVPYTRDISRLV